MHRSRVAATPVLVAALAVTAWGLVGTFGPRDGYTGALFAPDYTIPFVPPGGALEEAGFLAGDSVIAVEGTPVTELGMYSRWPRSLARQPGESLSLTVVRDGQTVERNVTFREAPPGPGRYRRIGLLVGLAFLWAGVWAFLAVGTGPAVILLGIGLAFGVALPAPQMGTWNGVRDHLQLAATALAALLFLRFFLTYPEPKRITTRRGFEIALFTPWVALLACLGVELAYHPRFYHSFGGYSALVLFSYLLLAGAAFAHTLVQWRRGRFPEAGLGIVAAALALALVPNLVAVAGWFIPPGFSTPGQEYFPALLAAAPVGMALGVRRHAQRPSPDPPDPDRAGKSDGG